MLYTMILFAAILGLCLVGRDIDEKLPDEYCIGKCRNAHQFCC